MGKFLSKRLYLETVKREIKINCMKLTWSAYKTFSYEIVEENSNEGKDYKLKYNFCFSEHSSNDEDKKFHIILLNITAQGVLRKTEINSRISIKQKEEDLTIRLTSRGQILYKINRLI